MESLKDKCMGVLCDVMLKAPLQIQEEILGEGKEKIKQKFEKEVREEVFEYAHDTVCDDLSKTLPWLVSEIVEDIKNTMIDGLISRQDFIIKYPTISPHVISMATNIAQNVVYTFEDQLVVNAFERRENYYNDNHNSSGEDEDEDEEYDDY